MAWRGEKIRFWFPVAVLCFCLVALATRLVMLHLGFVGVKKEPTYKLTRNTVALRGGIYSSTGVPYARTKVVWEYAVDPKAGDEDPTHPGRKVKPEVRWANITNLAESLNIPQAKVMDAYAEYARRGRRYVLLTTNEDETVHARLSGIHELCVSEKIVRVYPQGRDLSQVVGFIGFPTNTFKFPVGVAGIEQQFEKQLRGSPGHLTGLKNAHGRELRLLREISAEARPGNDVHLTIDHNIQHEVEKILVEGRLHHQAERVWAIVLEVKTGAVLAMATLPDYDPSRFTDSTAALRKNYAVAQVYDPGSVMKTITACAALNEGLVGPDTVISTDRKDPRYYRLPTDSHKMDDFLTVRDALVHSCNVVYGKLGCDLGPKRLWSYMSDFGFGRKTGIELPGEEKGLLPPWQKWDKLKWSRAPIGQGVQVTAIQLAAAYACIANDGELLQPYIVERIVKHDAADGDESAVVYRHERQVLGHPIRPETARNVREMMLGVAKQGGTARRAAVPGYTVAGKTGTAQIARPKKEGGGYYDDRFNASFIGIVPASRPKVVILVTYHRPFTCRRRDTSEARGVPIFNHQGGVCAGPTFSTIASFVLRYLAVEPDVPEEVPEDDDT
jgi:cell division protein FtsI/penicillin-binding protein 2